MPDTKTVIEALRCASERGSVCKQNDCPYYATESEDVVNEFCITNYVDRNSYPDDFWSYCDSDAIMQDAAKLLEEGAHR